MCKLKKCWNYALYASKSLGSFFSWIQFIFINHKSEKYVKATRSPRFLWRWCFRRRQCWGSRPRLRPRRSWCSGHIFTRFMATFCWEILGLTATFSSETVHSLVYAGDNVGSTATFTPKENLMFGRFGPNFLEVHGCVLSGNLEVDGQVFEFEAVTRGKSVLNLQPKWKPNVLNSRPDSSPIYGLLLAKNIHIFWALIFSTLFWAQIQMLLLLNHSELTNPFHKQMDVNFWTIKWQSNQYCGWKPCLDQFSWRNISPLLLVPDARFSATTLPGWSRNLVIDIEVFQNQSEQKSNV